MTQIQSLEKRIEEKDSEVNGLKTKLLIDTGASLTLLSKRMYDRLPDKPLEESRQFITSASGSRLCQYGKADFVIERGRSRETVEIMVADISVDGVLGLDLLKACKGDINFERSSLKLNNEDCRFSWEGTLGCYRVTADNDVCLPPRSEVGIQAKVPRENTFGSADYLVETEPKFIESGRALVGRTLVKGHYTLPVCLMNITESVQQIHGGTCKNDCSENVSANAAENSAKELRSDLRELFDSLDLTVTASASQPSTLRDFAVQAGILTVDASTQTMTSTGVNVDTQTEGTKRRRLDRVQKSYQVGGESVIEIHEVKEWF
uniref:Peptidase A2 domain-containing protein n=1 Tax=Magallana gigas TaxID=29159 RepID=A0A8W8MJF7_MAGGI